MAKRVVYLPVDGDRLLRVELDFDEKGRPASGRIVVYREEVGAVLDHNDIQTVRDGLGIGEG